MKKLVYDNPSVNVIKKILESRKLTFTDEDLNPYRVDTARTVHESLNLITYNEVDCLEDYEISESQAYKKFQGKLDQSPRKDERLTYD